MRMVTAGHAIKARGLNGLSVVKQPPYLGPHSCPHTSTARLITPAMAANHPHAAPRGGALDTLDAPGVTALSSRIAATAAKCLGLAPPGAHRERTRVDGDGHDTRDSGPQIG